MSFKKKSHWYDWSRIEILGGNGNRTHVCCETAGEDRACVQLTCGQGVERTVVFCCALVIERPWECQMVKNTARLPDRQICISPSFYLTPLQYTDTGSTSPSADPITPGVRQGNLWSVIKKKKSHWYDWSKIEILGGNGNRTHVCCETAWEDRACVQLTCGQGVERTVVFCCALVIERPWECQMVKNTARLPDRQICISPSFYLTPLQYTDTGSTSPSADPITPGVRQGNLWSVIKKKKKVTGVTGAR